MLKVVEVMHLTFSNVTTLSANLKTVVWGTRSFQWYVVSIAI